MEQKLVQKFGNSGHVVLPKEYVGKRIRFIVKPKTLEDIKSEVLLILKPYFENIIGIYLYGSYARNEQTIDSDIDILVVTDARLSLNNKVNDFSIVCVTKSEIEDVLSTNAILLLLIIKEAKTVLNPELLEKYKNYEFTKKNTKIFIDNTKRILELNKKGLELDFEIGSLVYSLMLRIRGLLIIKLMLNNKLYSRALLFNFLEENDLLKNKIEELYKIYSNEKNSIRVKKSDMITKNDISELLIMAMKLLDDVISLLK